MIREYAEQAAEPLLASTQLFQEELSPPRNPRDHASWEARREVRQAEVLLAAMELERFLHIHELLCKERHEPSR